MNEVLDEETLNRTIRIVRKYSGTRKRISSETRIVELTRRKKVYEKIFEEMGMRIEDYFDRKRHLSDEGSERIWETARKYSSSEIRFRLFDLAIARTTCLGKITIRDLAYLTQNSGRRAA